MKIINNKDFEIIKILISERYHKIKYKINNGDEDDVNVDVFRIITEMYNKYCGKGAV